MTTARQCRQLPAGAAGTGSGWGVFKYRQIAADLPAEDLAEWRELSHEGLRSADMPCKRCGEMAIGPAGARLRELNRLAGDLHAERLHRRPTEPVPSLDFETFKREVAVNLRRIRPAGLGPGPTPLS